MENVFNIKYNARLDKLQKPKEKVMNKVFRFAQNNKFIALACTSFIALSGINFYLICSFVKILENV